MNRQQGPRSLLGKLNRYTLVSVTAALGNAAIYATLLRTTGLHPTAANIMAAAVVSTSTFVVNRNWVWRARSSRPVRVQIVFYWTFTAVNVLLSSLLAWYLARRDTGDALLVAATAVVYTTTWALRFLFLDRVLFRAVESRVSSHGPARPGRWQGRAR